LEWAKSSVRAFHLQTLSRI